jgi:hypothetical protein
MSPAGRAHVIVIHVRHMLIATSYVHQSTTDIYSLCQSAANHMYYLHATTQPFH